MVCLRFDGYRMRDNGELYSEERPKKERQVLQWKKDGFSTLIIE